MNVVNKSVLITGANRGVGRGLLEEALNRGASKVYAGTRGDFSHPDSRVIPIRLDVTKASEIQDAAERAGSLDLLINNAGMMNYDDLSRPEVVEQHLAVNLLGVLNVSTAFLPLLKTSRGAIVNVLSLAGIAPIPVTPSYSISKAAALSLTQAMRMLLANQGVTVHGVMLGPVDTDMNRGFDIPKISPALAASNIFAGLAEGQEDIFPDPVSETVAEGWRNGVAKGLEAQFKAFVPEAAGV